MAGTQGSPAGAGVFLTTRWSRVVMAGEGEGAHAEHALEELCRDYWRPLYHYARRLNFSQEDAEDLTQGFITALLGDQTIRRADRGKGRFRTYLLSSFSHYIANFRRGLRTQKRGGGTVAFIPADAAAAEAQLEQAAPDWMTPERHYEESWAYALLDKVVMRLREEFDRTGRTAVFQAILPHLTGDGELLSYAKIGEVLGLSENAVTVTAYRMRKQYGALLREEIAATVATEEEVEDELRHLLQVVSGQNIGGAM